MAFEETSGGSMYMPVAPAYGAGNGMGFGGDWSWLIIVLLLCGGGWGFGGFGGMGGMMGLGMMDGFGLYPWLNNSQHISDGFRDQQLSTQLGGIQNAVTSGFGDVQTALCGGFAGVNATVNGAQNAISQQLYTNEIADLERSFAAQTANTQGLTSLSSQFANCCCENRLATCQTNNTIVAESAATRNAIQDGIQSIKDQLCQDKIDAKNDLIAQLRQEVLFARGQQSQDVQTAAIQAGQRALANEVEQYVLPTPRPAYIVQNPNCCTNFGCGCGVA